MGIVGLVNVFAIRSQLNISIDYHRDIDSYVCMYVCIYIRDARDMQLTLLVIQRCSVLAAASYLRRPEHSRDKRRESSLSCSSIDIKRIEYV